MQSCFATWEALNHAYKVMNTGWPILALQGKGLKIKAEIRETQHYWPKSGFQRSHLPQSIYWTWLYMKKSVSGHMLANEHRGSNPYMSVTVFCSVAVMGPEVTGGVNRCPFKTVLTVPQQHNLQALLEKSSSHPTVNFPLCGALEV